MLRYFRTIVILAMLLPFPFQCLSQIPDSVYHINFLPPGLHLAPIKANFREARVGLLKFLTVSDLRVDIGNSIDILGYENDAEKIKYTVGIDFLAYALSKRSEGLRLQIDALDGLFGGNFSASKTYDNSRLSARLRLLHQSGHFVDGHYDFNEGGWFDNKSPVPFTRDFGELVLAEDLFQTGGIFKYYGGISYATLVRPAQLERFEYFTGMEYSRGDVLPSILDHPTNIFAAYQFTLAGVLKHVGANELQTGVKFGEWYGKGPVIYLIFYSGPQFYGEYYDERIETIGAGFTMDFF
ncbi:MAG: hypothetical protein ACHQQQ_01070 [Bacteroidota bacterium]